MTTKIKEEFKLTKHDVEVCKSFLIFADRQIDFLKEIIEAAYKNQDWSYLGGNAYDVDSLSNMKQLIDRLVNSPIDKGQIETKLMSNIVLSKRQVIERLNSPLSSREKVTFLKWQRDNLSKSQMPILDKRRYDNYKEWLDTQININNNVVDDDDSTLF